MPGRGAPLSIVPWLASEDGTLPLHDRTAVWAHEALEVLFAPGGLFDLEVPWPASVSKLVSRPVPWAPS